MWKGSFLVSEVLYDFVGVLPPPPPPPLPPPPEDFLPPVPPPCLVFLYLKPPPEDLFAAVTFKECALNCLLPVVD